MMHTACVSVAPAESTKGRFRVWIVNVTCWDDQASSNVYSPCPLKVKKHLKRMSN